MIIEEVAVLTEGVDLIYSTTDGAGGDLLETQGELSWIIGSATVEGLG